MAKTSKPVASVAVFRGKTEVARRFFDSHEKARAFAQKKQAEGFVVTVTPLGKSSRKATKQPDSK